MSGTPDRAALAAASDERVLAWIERGLARLAEEAERGRLGPDDVGSPLSGPTFRDAIVTSAAVRVELEQALAALAGLRGPERIAMVLPSNVETVIVRPLVWALLARAAITVRVSSRRPGVAARLASILAEEGSTLARAIALAPSDRADAAALRDLVEHAERVHVWGSDETMRVYRALAGEKLVPHGSGLSLALLSRDARPTEASFDALALDVARYDQRGCLSPQALLVEEGGAISAEEAARALDTALTRVERVLPRGALTPEERSAERRFRDTAHALAALVLEGEAHAVSIERGELRGSPGLRNVVVHPVGAAAIEDLSARLGGHLKSVGVFDDADLARVSARLARPTAHVVPLGAMQTPSLLAPTEARSPWCGLATP